MVLAGNKTQRWRTVPLTPAAEEIEKTLPLGITYAQLRRHFEAAREKAGVPGIQFRDLRRTMDRSIVITH